MDENSDSDEDEENDREPDKIKVAPNNLEGFKSADNDFHNSIKDRIVNRRKEKKKRDAWNAYINGAPTPQKAASDVDTPALINEIIEEQNKDVSEISEDEDVVLQDLFQHGNASP